MGFWHTGYMEFHEPFGLCESVTAPILPEFHCDQCRKSFRTFDELRAHRFERHPARRPVILVRGKEIGGTPLRVTRALQAPDVRVLDASIACVNGRSFPTQELGAALARMLTGIADIRLQGAVTADFRLQFEIASDEDLAGVETCFKIAAHRGRLDRRAIEDFIEAARSYPTALAYCDGICEYLYGALAKERSAESSLRFEEYRDKFNRAADVLRDVQRPLAELVRALVAFHFNHFDIAAACAPSTRIASASALYLGWIHRLTSFTAESATPISSALDRWLTDLDTERILLWTLSPQEETLKRASELEALLKRDIPEFDRVKLIILLAEIYSDAGLKSEAQRHARELRNSPTLGTWSETILMGHP